MEERGCHILIADDEPQVLNLFTRLLTRGGYSVTAVDSGTSALKVLGDQPVDLLVLDLSMPPPDGFELLKRLRTSMPGLRILVTSGFMQGTLLKAAELLGATATLAKTDAPIHLLETVDHLLRKRPKGT